MGPHRRSIYVRVERKNLYPTFETFDHSARFLAVSQRGRTNTPLQALAVLNEPVFTEAADAVAAQMGRASNDPAEQVRWAYRAVLARDPTSLEFTALLDFYRESAARSTQENARFVPVSTGAAREAVADSLIARRLVANVILNLDTVLTKE